MSERVRKLIGAIMLLIFIPIYAWIVVIIAVAQFAESSTLVHTIYFAITGLIWVLPAGLIIKWMQKPVDTP